ncbi:MAG: hypothetical protein JWQ19_2118 [Subtercola sp.]|nr:hypothetical protein [Subtercola sp.]
MANVVISSAGLNTVSGVEMDSQAAAESLAMGGDPSGALSRPITRGNSDGVDLILVMTREQRTELAQRFPGLLRRIFTVREFARVVRDGQAATEIRRPDELVRYAFERRSLFPAASPGDDDIADPFRQSAEVHAAVAARISESIQTIAVAIKTVVARNG